MLEISGINLKIIVISELKPLSLQQHDVGMTKEYQYKNNFFFLFSDLGLKC